MIGRNIRFEMSRDAADALSDLLLERGALSVSVEDAHQGTSEEQAIFGEPGSNAGLWEQCSVTAMFAPDADTQMLVSEACLELQIDAPAFEVVPVPDTDWVKDNRDQFQPIQISSRIWIVPTWHDAPDAHATNIALDPGAAFGTGSHPTTRLCLQWLDANRDAIANANVIDYGCGSGILAIAAMKLGAARSWGVDIDVNAIEAAGFNAAQNQVAVLFSGTDRALDAQADITLANILANPLKVLAPLLAAHTLKGGHLVLAGILDHQAEEIIRIYADWFELVVWKQDEGWSCIAGIRR